MKVYWGVELQLHQFLPLYVMLVKWSTSLHSEDPPISMDPKTDLKALENKKSLRLAGYRTTMP